MRTTPVLVVLSFALTFGCGKKVEDPGADDSADESETDGGDGDGDATPTDGDGDGDPGDGDGDEGFVPMNDTISVTDCDPFAQDCPAGEKCVAYASTGGTWDANKCVTVTGAGTIGDQCTYAGAAEGTDDCDENHVCWNALDVDGVLVGTCFPFCTGGADNPSCEDASQSCRVVNDGTIAVCLPNCDPLLQECDDGLGCYWSGGSQTFQCIITAGGIPTGEPCGFNNDCNPGHFCADAASLETCNGSACCATFCDVTEDPSTCVAPLECVSFFEEGVAPPLYVDLGLCILPL
ncbi:hypothetical protein ENSA5_28000 [Enhygromyxa salina]|uniref:Endo-1,4-beta-xylanase A n=1 Tax=Enhygromyxa salina TaxID=215803 RepID=A0A2S9Y4I6_9BACT|nr:ribulose phosphate epimerase [Enhygromyxa salina]PRP99985.1 hypothetical protein ENSA5_28000 [Enhygromyxa salina]